MLVLQDTYSIDGNELRIKAGIEYFVSRTLHLTANDIKNALLAQKWEKKELKNHPVDNLRRIIYQTYQPVYENIGTSLHKSISK
ncbi:hypothetical protein CLV51_107185 [Chitinophaga niastensis]|uniref:Uncharacterized protein n=1 Tax=Chitinophaga niastensis TaxID=536980 RepID=A0A2P8HCD3_CHINA|nr:hypothetical protein [Chitinophaga niastensis]PSL43874.1 hypothetical protein CLV51_107185 [Chitinophaga niastensis]